MNTYVYIYILYIYILYIYIYILYIYIYTYIIYIHIILSNTKDQGCNQSICFCYTWGYVLPVTLPCVHTWGCSQRFFSLKVVDRFRRFRARPMWWLPMFDP